MAEPLPSVCETPSLSPKEYRERKKGREGIEKKEEKGEEKEDTSKIRMNTLFLSCYPKYTYILVTIIKLPLFLN